MKKVFGLAVGLLVSAVVAASPSYASLTTFQTFTGNDAVSTDGCGSTAQTCTLTANAAAGSTVVAAYLYTSTFFNGAQTVPTGDTLNGSAVTYTTNLGLTAPCCDLVAFRADVTSIVAPVINGGLGGAYNFTMNESAANQDGEALVVVYSNGSLATTTVGILDGFSAVTGDSTAINFSSPLDPTAAGFQAEMRLGIGFSCCDQSSTVTVNGTTITTVAGNNDDGLGSISNGQLITMGGDNDPFSTLLPAYADDHERYNLVPYITTGDTSINVRTVNPSGDDNIFLAVFQVTGQASFNGPPSTVPEPGTMALLGIGMAAMGLRGRKR